MDSLPEKSGDNRNVDLVEILKQQGIDESTARKLASVLGKNSGKLEIEVSGYSETSDA